jgi:hypothetical protein
MDIFFSFDTLIIFRGEFALSIFDTDLHCKYCLSDEGF